MTASAANRRDGGFALVIVLWTLGLLALLVAGLAAEGRTEVAIAGNLRDGAIAEAAAEGAVQRAIFELQTGTWVADGTMHRVAIGRASISIAIDDQSGRINPNFASPPLLAALLGTAGVDPGRALTLAREIADWRTATSVSLAGGLKLDRYRAAGLPYGPPNRAFASVDEVGLVPGMTAELLARLRPYVSVYQSGDPRLASASIGGAAIQEAEMMNRAPVLVGFTSSDQVVLIHATAVLQGGARFVRGVVVRLVAQPRPGEPSWQILTWD